MISRWGRYILFTGIILGCLVGGVAVYAALDLNPQQEFTDHPVNLIPIFFVWVGVVSFPFALITGIIEFVKARKK